MSNLIINYFNLNQYLLITFNILKKEQKYIISPEVNSFNKFSPKLKIALLASGDGSNFLV